MGSRKIDDLSDRFRPFVVEFLARIVESGIHVMIVETRRSEEEHQKNLANGVSWISRSKHCDGDAIDIAPTVLLDKKNWDPGSPLWTKLGLIAESVGLGWGGRWQTHPDLCHFEFRE